MFHGISQLVFLEEQAPGGGLTGIFMPLAVVSVIWIFMVILPARKEKARKASMLEALAKGDEVLMQSGIIGKIQSTKDDRIVLDCGGAKITFLRSMVAQVIDPKAGSKAS